MKQLKNEFRDKSGLEIARLCAAIALDTKAEDLIILDVRGLCLFHRLLCHHDRQVDPACPGPGRGH